MKKIIGLTTMLLLVQYAYSQSDYREAYIITNEGDTLNGFVDYREGGKNFKTCTFKKSKEDQTINYNPGEIKGYRFVNDKYFESREIEIDPNNVKNVFLEVLIKGKASLYKHTNKYFASKDTLFYPLNNEQKEIIVEGRIVEKYTNEHIGILSYLLSDCVGVRNRIEGVRISEKNLTRLIEKYNNCTGEPTITFKAKKPWLSASIGVRTGAVVSTIEFSSPIQGAEYLTSSWDKNYTLTAGADFELNSPRLNERIAFYAGVYYLSNNYISFNTQEQSFSIDRNDVAINLKHLKVPFGIRYTLPDRNFTPYFNLGASTTLHMKATSEWIKETERNNVIETFENEALEINKHQVGYWGGIGVKKSINARFTGNLEVRYELTEGISAKGTVLTSKVQNIQLLIGINF